MAPTVARATGLAASPWRPAIILWEQGHPSFQAAVRKTVPAACPDTYVPSRTATRKRVNSAAVVSLVRRRLTYVALALATIIVGLAVHLRGSTLGPAARDIVGDALWASMIVWWVSALAPRTHRWARCGAAYAICALVELSQAVQTPILDAIRATTIGQLVFGSGFDSRDFAAYAVGVAAAALLDMALAQRHRG